jgi:hypothetical protein
LVNIILILCAAMIISCGTDNVKNITEGSSQAKLQLDSLKSDTISTKDSISLGYSSAETDDYYSVCYSDFHFRDYENINENGSIKQGLAGIYRGQKYYYEIWRLPNGLAMNINYLFLRTDTTTIDTLDFCFVSLPVPDNIPWDSVVFHKLNKKTNEWIVDSSMTVQKFPNNFQPLIFSLIGYQNLYDIYKEGQDNPKIYFKGDNLYIKFWDTPRYGDHRLLLWIYKNDRERFRFEKETVLKTLKNENDN